MIRYSYEGDLKQSSQGVMSMIITFLVISEGRALVETNWPKFFIFQFVSILDICSNSMGWKLKVSATLKIAIFPYLTFQRFQIDMLESFLLKKKLEENIISVERYRG